MDSSRKNLEWIAAAQIDAENRDQATETQRRPAKANSFTRYRLPARNKKLKELGCGQHNPKQGHQILCERKTSDGNKISSERRKKNRLKQAEKLVQERTGLVNTAPGSKTRAR
jgi:hypothetical protein